MGLTPEQIQAIYEAKLAKQLRKAAPANKKSAQGGAILGEKRRRLTRVKTQYSKMPRNRLVRVHEGGSLRCESTGCGCPTHMLYMGGPVCQLHLIHILIHEVNLLSRYGTKSAGLVPDSPVEDSPAETAVIPTGDTSPIGAEIVSDNNGYL